MEVRPGYKHTEAGVIPEDWELKPLKGKIGISHGFAFASQHYSSHGTYRLTTPGHFYETGGFRDIGEKQKYYVGPVLSDYVLQPGNVIVAMTEQADGLLGSAGIIPNQYGYLHNQRLGRLTVLTPDIELAYMVYVFNSASYRSKVRETAAGTKVKHTSPEKLLQISVLLPPLPEQRAIAAALSDVDALLGGLERLIAKKRDLKQAAMQQLLTGQTRLPGFDGEWEVRAVRELGSVQTGPFGTLLKAEEYSGAEGVPLVSVGEIGAGRLIISEHTPRVPEGVIRRLPHYLLRTGDIVFGRKGAVDRCALIGPAEDGWFLGSDGIRLRPDTTCDPQYLAWQFQRHEVQAWLLRNAIGTTMASMNQSILNRVQIPYAPVSEQTAIAAVLSGMDAELSALEARRDKTRALKQGMMQELLTGRTRLVTPNEAEMQA